MPKTSVYPTSAVSLLPFTMLLFAEQGQRGLDRFLSSLGLPSLYLAEVAVTI